MTSAGEIFCGQYKDFLSDDSAIVAQNFKDSQQHRWNTISGWLSSQGGFPAAFYPAISGHLLPANYTISQVEGGHRCAPDNRPLINDLDRLNITPTLELMERLSCYLMLEYGRSFNPGFQLPFDPRLAYALRDYEKIESPANLFDNEINPKLSQAFETAGQLDRKL
jgi:hypothetical protein